MAASLYLTSDTVQAVTVPVASLIAYVPDRDLPGATRLLTTNGSLKVLEDVQTIARLLGDRPDVLPTVGSRP